MEAIVTAAIGAAIKLVELLFLGLKAGSLTQANIEREIRRINDQERSLIARWWSIARD